MESEVSLQHSEEPTTGPYLELLDFCFNPQFHIVNNESLVNFFVNVWCYCQYGHRILRIKHHILTKSLLSTVTLICHKPAFIIIWCCDKNSGKINYYMKQIITVKSMFTSRSCAWWRRGLLLHNSTMVSSPGKTIPRYTQGHHRSRIHEKKHQCRKWAHVQS
jgi:hypothetical protein